MTINRIYAATVLILAVALISTACSKSSKPGASPEAAVRELFEAIEKRDPERIAAAIDPAYSDDPERVGIATVLRLAELNEVKFENTNLRAEYDPTLKHARVFIDTKVIVPVGNAELEQKVLLTSEIDGRWYVTSADSPYWSTQFRPQPADWQTVQSDSNPNLPGQYVSPHPGPDGQLVSGDDRGHFANGVELPICSQEQIAAGNFGDPLCYHSNPPTSGPHAVTPAPWRIFSTPVAKEYLVHSMEHGGVIVWYNTNSPEAVRVLTGVVQSAINRGRLVAMTPYPGMEPDTIAITSWTRLDKFPVSQLTIERVERFIAAHERRFNPEGF